MVVRKFCWKIIIGSHKAVIKQSSDCHKAVIRQSSSSHPAVIKQSADRYRAVIRQLSSSHWKVIGQSLGTGKFKAVIGLSLSSYHQVIPLI